MTETLNIPPFPVEKEKQVNERMTEAFNTRLVLSSTSAPFPQQREEEHHSCRSTTTLVPLPFFASCLVLLLLLLSFSPGQHASPLPLHSHSHSHNAPLVANLHSQGKAQSSSDPLEWKMPTATSAVAAARAVATAAAAAEVATAVEAARDTTADSSSAKPTALVSIGVTTGVTTGASTGVMTGVTTGVTAVTSTKSTSSAPGGMHLTRVTESHSRASKRTPRDHPTSSTGISSTGTPRVHPTTAKGTSAKGTFAKGRGSNPGVHKGHTRAVTSLIRTKAVSGRAHMNARLVARGAAAQGTPRRSFRATLERAGAKPRGHGRQPSVASGIPEVLVLQITSAAASGTPKVASSGTTAAPDGTPSTTQPRSSETDTREPGARGNGTRGKGTTGKGTRGTDRRGKDTRGKDFREARRSLWWNRCPPPPKKKHKESCDKCPASYRKKTKRGLLSFQDLLDSVEHGGNTSTLSGPTAISAEKDIAAKLEPEKGMAMEVDKPLEPGKGIAMNAVEPLHWTHSTHGRMLRSIITVERRQLWWNWHPPPPSHHHHDKQPPHCPHKSQKSLAWEAIAALVHHGYIKTAYYLARSRVLERLEKPGSFLAAPDKAYDEWMLPPNYVHYLHNHPRGGKIMKDLMKFHTLHKFRSYKEFRSAEPGRYDTLLRETSLKTRMVEYRSDKYLVFTSALGDGRWNSMVVQKDLFCNSLVIIQGVSKFLVPPHSNYNSTPPLPQRCDMCPGSLPQTHCPVKSKKALANEAIRALLHQGYTKTAYYLLRSGALLKLSKHGSFLAPLNKAYSSKKLPSFYYNYFKKHPKGGAVSDLLMKYQTLNKFRSFTHFLKEVPSFYSTVLSGRLIRSGKFTLNNYKDLTFAAVPNTLNRRSLVINKNLFCNSLVIIQGTTALLIPSSIPPAPVPIAPTAALSVSEDLEENEVKLNAADLESGASQDLTSLSYLANLEAWRTGGS